VRLDTVRVTVGSRVDSTASMSGRTVDVITARELAARSGQSLAQILAAHLGVDVYARSPAQADIALRGSSIEQVLVLVNGHRVSDEQAGHFDLDLAVPTGLVERVEILRGTGSTLYGPNAVGGVINIVTRDRGPYESARVASGSFGTVGASLARVGVAHGIGLQAGVDFDKSDGHRPGTDYRVLQARVGGNAPLGAGRLRASSAVGVRDFGADAFYGPYPAFEDTHTSTASLDYDAPVGGRWTIHAGADARRHIDLFTLIRDHPSVYQNHHDNWQTGGDVVARYAAAEDVGLAVGAEGFDARLVSARLGDHQETRSAVYTELHLGASTGASLDAGIRGDHSSAYGDFVSPSLVLSAPVAPRTRMRASIGRGFRAPTWTERFYVDPANVGSSDLQSERFWAGEIGLSAAPTEGTTLDVAWYERRAEDLIDWARPLGAPDSVAWHTMNVESARYRGVEVTAEAYDLAGIDWTVRGSGLSFTPVGAAGFEGKYALRPITRTFGATAMLPAVRGVQAVIDVLDAQRAHEASYARADVRLGYAWRDVQLTADLRNVTSARYLDASGMPVAPRGLFVGLEWHPAPRS